MNTNTHPEPGQGSNLPPETSGNLPKSIDLLFILPGKDGKPVTHLHAEDAVAAGDAYWHIDPLGGERTLRPSRILPRKPKQAPSLGRLSRSLGEALGWGVDPDAKPKRKRTGKRRGFALWEMLGYLAAAAIVWSIFGAVVFGLLWFGSR